MSSHLFFDPVDVMDSRTRHRCDIMGCNEIATFVVYKKNKDEFLCNKHGKDIVLIIFYYPLYKECEYH